MGVTRRRQPKLPITKSVAAHSLRESLRFIKNYNLYFSEINRECSRRQPNRSHGCCPIQGGSPLPPPGPWTSKSLSDWTWCLHLDPSEPACPARCMSPERSQHPHAFPCCPGLPGPDDVQFNRPADFESRAMGPRPPARPRIGASR